MKLTKYKLMLVLPIPVTFLAGYYLAGMLTYQLERVLISREDKELVRLPDFELMEVRFEPEVVNVLSYLPIRKAEPKEVRQASQKVQESPPAYVLSFTYVGDKRSYAIINDRLLREGDSVSPEEKILKITRDGVLLSGKWGKRWLRISE
ncbi:hypothetical protein [Hydrogenivirga sp.]